MAIDRTAFNALVDDSGGGTDGTIWTKAQIQAVLLDPIDAELALANTWTPVIGGSGGTSGQTYLNQEGRWMEIGKFVWAAFYVRLSAEGTITGNVQIQGLPRTCENGTLQFYVGSIGWESLATNFVNLSIHVLQNTTTAAVVGCTAAAASNQTALTATDINNSTAFRGVLIYRKA